MTTVVTRTCDICGKELDRKFVHLTVKHDERLLVYYIDNGEKDLCMDCYHKGWAKLKGGEVE